MEVSTRERVVVGWHWMAGNPRIPARRLLPRCRRFLRRSALTASVP